MSAVKISDLPHATGPLASSPEQLDRLRNMLVDERLLLESYGPVFDFTLDGYNLIPDKNYWRYRSEIPGHVAAQLIRVRQLEDIVRLSETALATT